MSERTGAFEELQRRGMIEQCTDEAGVSKLLRDQVVTVYVGFDPTASSLHVGHLLPVMVLAHLQRMGHRPICLVGGATGMIGDPSGKGAERQLLSLEQVEQNVASVRKQLEKFVSFQGGNAALVVNNADWISRFHLIDWLRDVGKHFSVNYMIAKESVRQRLETREQGISYTEFSYMLMQAYDFLHLFGAEGCRLQGGGNDQWGNITAGIDLIRRVHQDEAYGITFPLLTTASGEKFGKSEGNAVWIDAELTSPYRFYQYWMNADDRDVDKLLKFFTFLPVEEIDQIMEAHRAQPERRAGQERLALEVTTLVHGEEGVDRARKATRALFEGDVTDLTPGAAKDLLDAAPSWTMPREQLGAKLIEALAASGACKSKGEARRTLQQGGVYVNGERVSDLDAALEASAFSHCDVAVIRLGKKRHFVIALGS